MNAHTDTHRDAHIDTHGEGENAYEVVVVGGGAAGLSAGLILGRSRRRTLVVDAGAPRNAPAGHMQGYLSRDGMSPTEFLAVGRSELLAYGVEVRPGEVTAASREGDGFALTLADGTALTARRLVVATGLVDELPAIRGLAERWGRDVLHCPFCHGWEVRDRPLGVVAHPAMPAHQALMVSHLSSDVTLFLNGVELTGEDSRLLAAAGVRTVAGAIEEVAVEDDRMTGVRLADGRTVGCAALFAAGTRLLPRDGVLRQLGAETYETPFGAFVKTDEAGRTSVPGVWAAGNVTGPAEQVVNAASAGYRAGALLHGELLMGDLAARAAERVG
ncbi:NAD(P)/FAD-dependent oxidoreductase [Streptomyces sp. NPDC055051]